MSITYRSALNSNALFPFLFLVNLVSPSLETIVAENSVYQYDQSIDRVFRSLPTNILRIENTQMDILLGFVSKIMTESRDLEEGIVDMVNQNFWDLI